MHCRNFRVIFFMMMMMTGMIMIITGPIVMHVCQLAKDFAGGNCAHISCTALHSTALHCGALWSIALHCGALCTVHCGANQEVCGLPPGSQGAPSCGGLVILLPPLPFLIIPIACMHHSVEEVPPKKIARVQNCPNITILNSLF